MKKFVLHFHYLSKIRSRIASHSINNINIIINNRKFLHTKTPSTPSIQPTRAGRPLKAVPQVRTAFNRFFKSGSHSPKTQHPPISLTFRNRFQAECNTRKSAKETGPQWDCESESRAGGPPNTLASRRRLESSGARPRGEPARHRRPSSALAVTQRRKEKCDTRTLFYMIWGQPDGYSLQQHTNSQREKTRQSLSGQLHPARSAEWRGGHGWHEPAPAGREGKTNSERGEKWGFRIGRTLANAKRTKTHHSIST